MNLSKVMFFTIHIYCYVQVEALQKEFALLNLVRQGKWGGGGGELGGRIILTSRVVFPKMHLLNTG